MRPELSFKALLAVGILTAPAASIWAQHEVDTSAGERGPIKISGNENAFGYSQMAMMAIMQELPDINRYAGEETKSLIDAISVREMVPAEYIMPTAGSGPVLQMAAMAYAEEGKNMITVAPGYMQLTRTFEAFGGSVKTIPVNDSLEHDLDAMMAAIDEDTVLVYICNPNNPTGTTVDPEALSKFIDELPASVVAFVDEAYLELADGGLEKHSMIAKVREGKNVILARTFSKVYGMAGLRVGYGVMSPDKIKSMRKYSMGGPNKLGCVAGVASLQDAAFFEQSVSSYRSVRSMVTDKLDEWGIEYAKPQGSFVFVKTGIPIDLFQKMMESEQIMVGRPFPPMLEWCRVSIGTEEEMAIFLESFEKVMAGAGKLALN